MIHPNLREKILEEAIGILYRDGVDHITMRALASALDYSPATLYRYFRSKRELIREVALLGFARLEEEVEVSAGVADPAEAVAESMRRYIRFGLTHPQLYRLMFQEFRVESYSRRELAHFGLLWAFGRSLHVRGIEAEVFHPGDPDVETSATWAMVHGFVQLALSQRLPSPAVKPSGRLEALRDAVIESRLRGLRRAGGIR
jgi:AcrR family transcriptional regulator